MSSCTACAPIEGAAAEPRIGLVLWDARAPAGLVTCDVLGWGSASENEAARRAPRALDGGLTARVARVAPPFYGISLGSIEGSLSRTVGARVRRTVASAQRGQPRGRPRPPRLPRCGRPASGRSVTRGQSPR